MPEDIGAINSHIMCVSWNKDGTKIQVSEGDKGNSKTLYIFQHDEQSESWIKTTKEYEQKFNKLAISPTGDDIVLNGMKTPKVEKLSDITIDLIILKEIKQNILEMINSNNKELETYIKNNEQTIQNYINYFLDLEIDETTALSIHN